MSRIKRIVECIAAFLFHMPRHPLDEAGKTEAQALEDLWYWSINSDPLPAITNWQPVAVFGIDRSSTDGSQRRAPT